MMEVQKFLKEHGIEELQKQFAIVVTDYPDRVVLNYNQIESPRFVSLVDECRALILRKGTWEVLARSFDRFYNLGESVDPKMGLETQRIADPVATNQVFKTFVLNNESIIEDKLDGSLLSLYHDGDKWCVSTRKMAFAEGKSTLGRTFSEIFFEVANRIRVTDKIEASPDNMRDFTYVFELTGPENRVVTPYSETDITLIGCRSRNEAFNYRELSVTELNNLASYFGVRRPGYFSCASYEELLALVKSFPTMQEGVVLKIEVEEGSHRRIKCKNPQYVAVAHMRENGGVSPKNVLNLVIANEHFEYLKYFGCDKPYFDFVEDIYAEIKNRIASIYQEHKDIKDQKEFALTIMPKTVYAFEKGVIFSLRKNGNTVDNELKDVGAKKIAIGINLKQKFIDKFHIVVEDDEEK